MRIVATLGTQNLARTVGVLFVLLLALAAGLSGLVFESPKSPLVIAGAALAIIFAVVLLRDPVWASCAAIFIVLLPRQILLSTITLPVIRDYTVLICLLVACLVWLLRVLNNREAIVWNSTILLMIAFLVWGITTLFWAPELIPGRRTLMGYAIGFTILFLHVNNIGSRNTLNRLMATLALNGWVLMLVSADAILREGYISGTRLEVQEMNENDMGILALVTMVGVLWQVMQKTPRRRHIKILLSCAFLVMTIGLVAASGSRGSAISLIITLLAFCCWKSTRKWGLFGLVILGLGIIVLPLLFTTTLERFAVVEGDTFLGGREVLWQATLKMIGDHMWLGVGIGNGRYELLSYLAEIIGIGDAVKAPTHNPVLQVWAETGLLGIFLYLGVLGSAVWSFIRNYLNCKRPGMQVFIPYFALVFSTFLGYMASWIKAGGAESSLTYYLILSLLLIPANFAREDQKRRDSGIELFERAGAMTE